MSASFRPARYAQGRTLHSDVPNASNTRLLAWQWFKCQIPWDWEVTAYDPRRNRGRLLLESRHGPKAEVSWEVSPDGKQPDLQKTIEAFHRGGADESAPADQVQYQIVGGFHVSSSPERPRCAVGYLPEVPGILRWIFFDGQQPRGAVDDVLLSCVANLGPVRNWAAWGLECHIPADFTLHRVRAQPANISLEFTTTQHRQLTVSRFGMPGVLLNGGSLGAFHRRWLAQANHLAELIKPSEPDADDSASLAAFRAPAPSGVRRAIGGRWMGQSCFRLSAEEPRIHGLTQLWANQDEVLRWEEVFHVH